MSKQQSRPSKREIEASLQQVQGSEQKANQLLKADNKLIILGALSYGISVFSFGYDGTLSLRSPGSFFAMLGFFVFIGVVKKIEKTHKENGVKQRQMPHSYKGFVKTSLYGGFFAVTYAGSFLLYSQGFTLAPLICAVAASSVLALFMYKYPNFHAQP